MQGAHLLVVGSTVDCGLAHGFQSGVGGGGRQGLWRNEGFGGRVPDLLGGVGKEADLRPATAVSQSITDQAPLPS